MVNQVIGMHDSISDPISGGSHMSLVPPKTPDRPDRPNELNRPDRPIAGSRAIDGRIVEKGGDPAALGWEGSGENRGAFGTSAGVK